MYSKAITVNLSLRGRRQKGEGREENWSRAKRAEPSPSPSPPPARFRFPFSLPFSSACHAGYVNFVCDIISCFANILSVASKLVASYADALWARHAIFLPHEITHSFQQTFVGEEDCVTSPKSVCVGGYLKADTFLSHSHVVTGKVENILRYSVMLGYIVWMISFKVADTVVGTVLGSCRDSSCSLLLLKMYTYLFFFYSENSDRFP